MVLFPYSKPSSSLSESDEESLSIEKVDVSVSVIKEEKKVSASDAYGRGYAERN